MRTILVLASAALLAACASQSTTPEKVAAAPVAKPGPQCYSGDHGRFFNVEEATTIAGLVIHEAQTIPEEKQAFTFHGKRFVVLKREKNRIVRLRSKAAEEPLSRYLRSAATPSFASGRLGESPA